MRKSYGGLRAVDGVDLTIERGEVFALLGPNGAGKTTTVEILEGYRSRDAGEVSVLGFDPADAPRRMRERIGIVLQSTGIEPYLSVRETLELHAGYYPRPRPVDEVLELVGLRDAADRRVKRLSGGQRRRVDLAVALVGDGELLFLDEPTTGFDPSARRQAWETVRALAGLGKTIVLTTHFMDEAHALADRVAIMSDGRVVASGTVDELVAGTARRSTVRFTLPDGSELPDAFGADLDGGRYTLETDAPTRLMHELTDWALSADIELVDLAVSRPSLEEVYLELTDGNRAPSVPEEAPVQEDAS